MNGPFEWKWKNNPITGEPKGILFIKNCKTIYRNFSGRPTKFTDSGRRQINVLIDDELAAVLEADGWNIKSYKDRSSGGEKEIPFIKVNVKYKDKDDKNKAAMDPVVKIIKNGHKEELNEETVGMLDWAEIDNVDIYISPYHWNVNGDAGVTGYLREAIFTLAEDELESLYVSCGSSCDGNCDKCAENDMEMPFAMED